jgi:hypothetical protein
MLRRAAAALVSLALALPSVALAHEGNPNYRSEVRSSVPGVGARVADFDDRLELDVTPGREVIVLGYEGEPYVRFQADGAVEVNRRSPAGYLNEDRFAAVEVPSQADPEAPPEWEPVAPRDPYSWHDHRIHYMSRDLPPQVDDESVETKVFDWRVPVLIDGRRDAITGTLTWVPDEGGPSIAVAVGLGAAVLASLAFAVWRIRRRLAAVPEGQRDDGGGGEAW